MDDRTKKPIIREVVETQIMKPDVRKKKRPVMVVKKSTLKRRHYARKDR